MIEEVAKNIYRIGVVLPGNPLKELNSYLIRSAERELLIDTGFRRDACREALEAGLQELGSDPSKRDVLVTHLHSDHSGMADLFAGPGRHIYISAQDYKYMDGELNGTTSDRKKKRFLEEGFTEEEVDYIRSNNPARVQAIPKLTDNFVTLNDLDVLEVGEYRLQMLLVPGHTPGNAMFWEEKSGIMFTGDHVLFDITPNITEWADVEDSLGKYLDSLRRVREYPVKLALPGHRKTGDYHARIDELLRHHEWRLKNAFEIVSEEPGLNAYEITGRMRWKIRARSWEDFPSIQRWFAVGECLSHLDYLMKRGKVRRTFDGMAWHYFPAED